MPPVNRNKPIRAESSESRYTLVEFMREFPDDATCLEWLWRNRYSPDGVHADCPKCEAVLAELKCRHRKVTRLSLEKLSKGEEPDVDAMAHLALTGGAAPLVFIDGRFLEPEEVEALAG